jgi:hypothetical protein
VCARAVRESVDAVAFGDLFLADVRAYRERQLQGTGLEPLFPIWGMPTKDLAKQMITSGLRAKLTCVDTKCPATSTTFMSSSSERANELASSSIEGTHILSLPDAGEDTRAPPRQSTLGAARRGRPPGPRSGSSRTSGEPFDTLAACDTLCPSTPSARRTNSSWKR